jgi:hypothetical protein
MTRSAFLIGIDLGTTNSTVAAVDTRERSPEVRHYRIPQLVAPGVVESAPALPSFLYFPSPDEIAAGGFAVPWDTNANGVVGTLARDRGALAPARLVSSAKSWLVHPAVDRRAAFLPPGASGDIPRISPVDASVRYLRHMRDAWNATVAAADPSLRFERQTIVLTVPASFDEQARELTVEAASLAQLSSVILLEEPVAAFYAWMAARTDSASLEDDVVALVCDVGGGTTDFSLIRLRIDAGALAVERIAIGDHLLLGGDNVDLALAALAERKIAIAQPTRKLALTERSALQRLCSAAKERLLSDGAPDDVRVTVLGAGRSVVGGTMTVSLARAEVEATLGEFLPIANLHEIDDVRASRAGLRELGLPYEPDPAITRHLARFLARAADVFSPGHRALVLTASGPVVRPDLLLFNGGFFIPAVARDRITGALAQWFGQSPCVLESTNLETAVAVGAATYARLRAGVGAAGTLVKAGSGRAYYVALGAPRSEDGTFEAVCVLARGTPEGTEQTFEHLFVVTANRPVSFTLCSSTTRADRAGDIVQLDAGIDALQRAPLVTVFRYGRKSRHVELPVRVSATFTEVGTLELWCRSETSDHRWRLQFQVRGTDESDQTPERAEAPSDEVVIPDDALVHAESVVRALFTGAGAQAQSERDTDVSPQSDVTPENVVARLEHLFGYAKAAWPIGAIRRLADTLLEVADGRRRSAPFEARWLNLIGFCLRPGFGAAKDPWRIGEARKIYAADLVFPGAVQNRAEWLVLWQRASGGFTAGQQREVAQRIIGELGVGGRKPGRITPQIERESWRMLASLERLDPVMRVKIGDEVIRRLRRDPGNTSLLWSIGRLGARTPIYGPLTSVVPAADAARWLEQLIALRPTPELVAAIVEIGARTGDPLRDLDEAALDAARRHSAESQVHPDALRALSEVVARTFADASRAFGEPLPNGLRLEAARH